MQLSLPFVPSDKEARKSSMRRSSTPAGPFCRAAIGFVVLFACAARAQQQPKCCKNDYVCPNGTAITCGGPNNTPYTGR
jgi:hypothetical protein